MTDATATIPAHRAPVRHDSAWRMALRGFGQLLITLGVVLLLFVVYELYITGLYTARAQRSLETQFNNIPVVQPHRVHHVLPPEKWGHIPEGGPVAVMYVPRFGHDWHMVVVQGTGESDLQKGPGHYTAASCGCHPAYPGQPGNFAVAGHRTTYLHPFWSIDTLQRGDKIYLKSKEYWYTYTVKPAPKTPGYPHVPFREIVDPTDVPVSFPVPDQPDPNKKPTLALMTMTACNPKYSAAQRIVVHSVLTNVTLRSNPPAALVAAH